MRCCPNTQGPERVGLGLGISIGSGVMTCVGASLVHVCREANYLLLSWLLGVRACARSCGRAAEHAVRVAAIAKEGCARQK